MILTTTITSRVTVAVILLLGLARTSFVSAQEPRSAPQSNDIAQIISDVLQTNDLFQAEDMIPADDAGQPDEPGVSNAIAPDSSDQTNAIGPSEPRHSGRESRSRRFSSQRASQSNRFRAYSDSTSRGSSQPGTNTGPISLEYSAFRLVAERNIFNPNRYPHTSNYRPPNRDPEYFTLVGLMSYEKGTFAFFSGSSSAYQKALRAAESIAGYKLTAIDSNSVTLARDNKQVQLTIGMQMRHDDDDTWQLVKNPTLLAARSPADSPPSAPSPSALSEPGSAPGGAESDIVKRMMQRREQE